MKELPYLTSELSGIGGRIKQRLEDFRVEEIPLYAASGKGTHVYFKVIKAGIPTPVAVARIARYMGARNMDVGVAGLKDSQALTSQWMSLEYADASKLARLRDANIRIENVTFHTNKLRIGHLAGNRFAIRIRGVGLVHLEQAQRIMDVLARRGVPNFFGTQRFGSRGDTGTLGGLLVRRDFTQFVRVFLGAAVPADPPDIKAARDAFDAGYYDRAMKHWPRHYTDQRHALIAFKRRSSPAAAVAAIDKRLRRLFVSAFQSEIFNDVLTRRIQTIDTLLPGDMAQKTDNGGVFLVEDPSVEQERCRRFEISPTGPIIGTRSTLAQSQAGQIEQAVLDEYQVKMEDFRRIGELHSKGTRRALRFKIESPQIRHGSDSHGAFIELEFIAPSGCYATVLLRELMKTEVEAGEPSVDDDD